MNDTFEDRLCELARQGLERRLDGAVSPGAAAAIAAHAAVRARRVRLLRALRRAAVAAAPVAACAALVFLHSGAGVRPAPPESDGVRPMAALVALATVVTEGDAEYLPQDGVAADVDFGSGSDFDAFAESVVLMQESACGLGSMLAGE